LTQGRGATWCVRLTVPAEAMPLFEVALGELGGAQASGVPGPDGRVTLEAYLSEEPDRARIAALLAAASLAAGTAPVEFDIEPLPDLDWVAESRKALPPIQAGPFYVYGAHVTEPPPEGAIPIKVEASVAFGTGQHETTRGCLLALADLAKGRRIATALDMGCGTGILAIAVAKLWRCRVIAVDNDPDAVRLTVENAAVNGVAGLVSAHLGDGYRCPAVADHAPYDLIVANILADPLQAMAPDLIRTLAPGGVAILSGLLTEQADGVCAAHRPLELIKDYPLNEWTTLVLSQGDAAGP
jgi:ribosomal protein L11 methyltransferase